MKQYTTVVLNSDVGVIALFRNIPKPNETIIRLKFKPRKWAAYAGFDPDRHRFVVASYVRVPKRRINKTGEIVC